MISRRSFLIDGLRITAAVPFLSCAAGAVPRGGVLDRSLVVVQLTGGNDGLNTVVPHRQDLYYSLRPTLALARNALVPLTDDLGLHPELHPLRDVHERGDLAVVQAVGYPNPDRSHFRSMEIWHTGSPDGTASDPGWLGRIADQIVERHPERMPALHVGSERLPLSLWGRKVHAPSVRDADAFRLHERGRSLASSRDALLESSAPHADLGFLRDAARTSYDAAERLAELSAKGSQVAYPDTPLAQKLKLVARLLAGRFGSRIFHVELDGFDTHIRQARTHGPLMAQLGGALAAFQNDLEAEGMAQDVTTLVFSEFGRRVRENGSRGTDHGAGAPLFLMGARVRGGLHGRTPDLGRLVQGDVPFTTDFRSVYASLESQWLGFRPSSGFDALPLFET